MGATSIGGAVQGSRRRPAWRGEQPRALTCIRAASQVGVWGASYPDRRRLRERVDLSRSAKRPRRGAGATLWVTNRRSHRATNNVVAPTQATGSSSIRSVPRTGILAGSPSGSITTAHTSPFAGSPPPPEPAGQPADAEDRSALPHPQPAGESPPAVRRRLQARPRRREPQSWKWPGPWRRTGASLRAGRAPCGRW